MVGSMIWQLWLGFAMGVLARWGDRIQFVISETQERSFSGYLKSNWGRLVIRGLVTCYIFYVVLGEGWVTNRFVAFSVGLSADVMIESFLDRAKRTGENILRKTNGGTPEQKP